jgi:hypothetical protein
MVLYNMIEKKKPQYTTTIINNEQQQQLMIDAQNSQNLNPHNHLADNTIYEDMIFPS